MNYNIQCFEELRVYKKAFTLQQRIFTESHSFPVNEKYALTDQIRRSSRSIGANLAEAWQKRAYPAHFISKLSDADGEQAETQHWLNTALECRYLNPETQTELLESCKQIGRMIGGMMRQADSFCKKQT